MTLTKAEKSYRTEWASQFLAAAELVRRNYFVSFTMGSNAPVADLMVGTRGGGQFWVDVKGLSSKADWIVKPKAARERLFYILVLVSPAADRHRNQKPDQFYVLTQAEANQLEHDYRTARPANKTTMRGFTFRDAEPHRDRWDKLPCDDA